MIYKHCVIYCTLCNGKYVHSESRRFNCHLFSSLIYPPGQYLNLYVTWQYVLLYYRATGAIAPHCGFSGVCETAPIEVLLRPTLFQSDEPSDLRGSLSPTTRHRCMHVLVYTAPGGPRRSPIQLWTGPGVAQLQ